MILRENRANELNEVKNKRFRFMEKVIKQNI